MQERWHVTKWYVDKRFPTDIANLKRAGVNAAPNLDVHGEDASRSVRPMIDVVSNILKRGKLHLDPSMRWHRLEMERYQYKDAETKNAGENPLDKDNHAMDAMRYAICSVEATLNITPQRVRQGQAQHPLPKPTSAKHPPGYTPPVPTPAEHLHSQERRMMDSWLAERRRRR